MSWLPPSHPKAAITKSAANLRKELDASQPEQDENDDDAVQQQQQPMDGIEIGGGYSSDSNQTNVRESAQQQQRPKPPIKKAKARDLEKVLRTKSERRSKRMEGALDPMDPAAYSDIPKGKWSAGLECENSKTGADSTVSGTMYQMRPYPAPGAILRANAKKGKGGSDSDNSDHDDN